MTVVPELEHHRNSWVIVDRTTGNSVFETFEQNTAERINTAKYEVITTLQWLTRFNQKLKSS